MPKLTNKIKKITSLPLTIVLLTLVGVLIFSIGMLIRSTYSNQLKVVNQVFHGPHINIAVYNSGFDQAVLGSRASRTTNRMISASVSPKPTATPFSVISSTATLNADQLGIAAGGGLTGMNQNELEIYFSRLYGLGVGWVRFDFDWGSIQSNGSGSYNWSATDLVVATAKKHGIKILGIITYTPIWAQTSSCKGDFGCAPANPNSFGLFAGAVATHYSPMGVHNWEIWNEPNINVFWKTSPSPAGYVAILKSSYSNIKKADPSAFILTGGLSPSADDGINISPISFIKSLYQLDTTKDFDGIALHPYSYPVLPSYSAPWNSWQQISSIRQLMQLNGDQTKPIWITEYGAPTGGSGRSTETSQLDFNYGSDYMSESAQSSIMYDALSLFTKLQGSVDKFFWYSLVDNGTSSSTPENFFGLIRFDGSKKRAYDTFRSLIKAQQ